MSNEFESTKFIYADEDKIELLVLPTIQSLTMPDTSTIPSKPTIAGEYRNQYVAASPIRATFVVWLEEELYIDTVMNVSSILTRLYKLKNNRLRFSVSTSHTDEESRYLHDMVIESIATSRDASRSQRIVVTINCTQVKFVNLTWKMASAVDIFGREIFTSQTNQTRKMDFVPRKVDDDFSINSGHGFSSYFADIANDFETSLILTGHKDAPVNWQIKNIIASDVPLKTKTYYYRLAKYIDFSEGSKTYICNCSVQSSLGGSEEPYNVDIGQFTITVNKDDGTIVPNFPMAYAVDSKYLASSLDSPVAGGEINYTILADNAAKKQSGKIRGLFATSPYIYDFADTYGPYQKFSITKTFDRIEPWDTLSEYLTDKNTPISKDERTLGNNIIVKDDGYVYTRKIKDRYDFSVGYNDTVKSFVPDGGLKVDVYTLTTEKDRFKPTVEDETFQETFDDLYTPPGSFTNYTMYVVVITLGALLQIYLFAPNMFNSEVLANVEVSSDA